MPFIIFFSIFCQSYLHFPLYSAMSFQLLDRQELSQRQTMLMNQRCVSINVFLYTSWWELCVAANSALETFFFFLFFFSLSSILGLRGKKGKWFQSLSNCFLSDWLWAFSDVADHSQEAKFQSKQADKGHWKTIHSDYVVTHNGHKELNKMSIKAGSPSLTQWSYI